MGVYPVSMTLRYCVGADWLEQQTLAGKIVEDEHDFVIEFDRLDDTSRDRAVAIFKQVDLLKITGGDDTQRVRVVGSGVEPDLIVSRGEYRYGAARTITNKIGALPELAAPASSAEQIIDAYDAWLARYQDLSLGAFLSWLKNTAPEGDLDAVEFPEAADYWRAELHASGLNGGSCVIDGRHEPELLKRAKAALQLRRFANDVVDREDTDLAAKTIGLLPIVSVDAEPAMVVGAYEAHSHRWANMALARYWTRQRQKAGFDMEMLRWSREHGSPRLRLGLDDGYRMMPVYLDERIAREAPGFYAHLPKDGAQKVWQPRTGPSEEALRLRRAVQDKLGENQFYDGPPPKAEIGWVKNPPPAMYNAIERQVQVAYDIWEDREDPFEVIVVPDWLGRYVLIAAVFTEAEDQPPDYILLKHTLRPKDYGLDDLPEPPIAETMAAARKMGAFSADDDIPF